MKHLYKILFILILSLTSCKNELKIDITENEQEAIKKVEQVVQGVFDEIWGSKDETAIKKYQTEDFILLEHGEVWTNDTIAKWCKAAKLRDNGSERINTFDFFKAKKEHNRIWMTYHNYATFKKDSILGKYEWLESVVAVKKDSVWKIEMMHSTRVPGD